jgi:hypothetical protein
MKKEEAATRCRVSGISSNKLTKSIDQGRDAPVLFLDIPEYRRFDG